MTGAFLTAEWRWLAMLNYRVPAELLTPHVPAGTELDTWDGHCYVSVVGFLFRNTRVLGIGIPLYRHFEEVNLRFYVSRSREPEVRRGVTFLRELVPRRAIAAVARRIYNEPYLALPMRHSLGAVRADTEAPASIEYAWRQEDAWRTLSGVPTGVPAVLRTGSEEEFITEHHWGYTRQRDGSTIEYRVEHPPWRVWALADARIQGDLTGVYGNAFARELRRTPDSAFLAEGSSVTVMRPVRLEH